MLRRTASHGLLCGMIAIPTLPGIHLVFDLLAWLASAGLGVVLYRWRLRELTARTARVTGPGYVASLAVGAIAGAWLSGSLNTLMSSTPTLSHSVVGALAGAVVGVEAWKRARGVRGSTGGIFTGPFALGIAVGRLGCLFEGLPDRTYGVATILPWGVDLGDGVSRHPVQIYESLAMLTFVAVYVIGLARRAPWAMQRSFYVLCIWYGAQRFVWEFLKPYPSLAGPFTLFHLICVGLIIYGAVMYGRDLGAARTRRDGGAAQGRALSVLRPDDEPV
jgi:phosphatidylglycerol:prolipoprotein diacylglycerol transferase|tara:strand:- start:2617 stop:3444 length:828 start_codon:yes stop_codon:yes gene_type:complete